MPIVAITGASSGIGRACAELLAARGDAVVLNARRGDRLRDIVGAIVAKGGRAVAVPGDVTRDEDMRALVDRAIAEFGRLDVMIANAGIGYHGPFEGTPLTTARSLVDVNLVGTLYAAHAAWPVFTRQRAGHLIAVSSIVGRRGVGGSAVYSATKAAQVALIEGLRAEALGTGVRASVVFPVSTITEFHDAMRRDHGHHFAPVGPRQTAGDVARAIARCIDRPRAEVYPYRRAKLLAILGVTAPASTDRLLQRYRRRVRPVEPPSPHDRRS